MSRVAATAVALIETTEAEKGAETFDHARDRLGRGSKTEELGHGGAEFVPWRLGAVM